jgi:hypothetical protein
VETSFYSEQDCVAGLNGAETLIAKVGLIYSLNSGNVILINDNIILKAYAHVFSGTVNVITVMWILLKINTMTDFDLLVSYNLYVFTLMPLSLIVMALSFI